MNINNSVRIKLILLLGFLSVISLILYVKFTGYEPRESFYNNLTIIPIFILLNGIVFISLNRYTTEIYSNTFLYTAYFIYLISNAIVFSELWAIKYGDFAGFDWWLHLHDAEKCLNSSHLDLSFNFYPTLTLLISEFSLIINVSSLLSYKILLYPYIFINGSVLFCLLKSFSNNLDKSMPIGITSLIILTNPILLRETSIEPWILNIAYLSLYIYLFDKYLTHRSTKYGIPLVIFLFLITITHPIGNIFILLSSAVIYLSFYIFRTYNKVQINKKTLKMDYIVFVFILLVSWIVILTGFITNQLAHVLSKIPDILFINASAQQLVVTNKSFLTLFISRFNFVSNTFLVSLSIVYILIDFFKSKCSPTALFSYLSYVLAGFLLYFFSQYFLGKTDFSGTQIRYFYYASITFSIFIYYLFLKQIDHININFISGLLLIIFFVSVLTIHPVPGLDNQPSHLTTESTYAGLDWGNVKIIWDESQIITGADYISQYVIYNIGSKIYPSMYGSTNGLLTYFNYNSSIYKHRQEGQKFTIEMNNNLYLYYYPLMEDYVAYSKYDNKMIGITPNSLDPKKINKIYNSFGFSIFKIEESEKKNLSNLL